MYGTHIEYDRHGHHSVVDIINLFFKGVLLFPIFMLAIYIGIAMFKHVIFHGVPTMNKPTEEQQESLRDADARLGLPATSEVDAGDTDMAAERLTPQEASEAIQESLQGTGITPQLLQETAPPAPPVLPAAPVRPYAPTAVTVPSRSQWEKREVNGRMVDVRVNPDADELAPEQLPGWVR